MSPDSVTERETLIEASIKKNYNATIKQIRLIHPTLMIITVVPDSGEIPEYLPGQYTTLGLGTWEDRHDGPSKVEKVKVIRRAYSISCPMLNEENELLTCKQCDFYEFYISLVEEPDADNPLLTPRLFASKEGDRIHLGKKVTGAYTLKPVSPEDNVILLATGTGEAPHNAMATELLANGHKGKIVSLTSVRVLGDAAYTDKQIQLNEDYENYQYSVFTTREPVNLDKDHPNFVGKKYLQHVFQNDMFETSFGWNPDPKDTHIFLCGNPAMIGIPSKDDDGNLVFPASTGMIEILVGLGFTVDAPQQPANIHFEKYW